MARYKIHSNQSVTFLYSKDKQADKKLREITPFIIITNGTKYLVYLGVTLTKQVKDLYDKNFKSLKKEIKEDLSPIGGTTI
jgi:glutamate synthase domain-containing protein 1